MEKLLARLKIDPEEFRRAVDADLQALGAEDRYQLSPLAGGASIRGYARLTLTNSTSRSMVMMLLLDPDPARGVEEAMAAGVIQELPFINVQRHLAAAGVAAPEIYRYNAERGLLYLEDLGSAHLRDLWEERDPEKSRATGEAAIRELVKIQVDAARRPASDFLGFMVKFDHGLLRWELDHFTEHAIKRRFPGALSEDDEQKIAGHFEEITAELLSGPQSLLHRDYMLDNLMFKDGRVRVIDFQDALIGPLAYDLACLLYDRDASALLGPELIEHFIEFYPRAYQERSGERLDPREWRRCFELCVIHRMLKVVGRFHFIDQVKKRPEYLRFIPFMLPVIADYLGRDEKHRGLLDIIARHLPELARQVPPKA